MFKRWDEEPLVPVSQTEQCVVILLFLACGFLFYADTLTHWFVIDDPNALSFAARSFREIFFSTSYDPRFYTPLVGLSLKPDVLIFGLNPLPYRIHNVIILVLIAVVIYRILRRQAPPSISWASALMVIISAPSIPCIAFITLRQYLYPMLFSLIAIYLFIQYSPSFRTSPAMVLLIAVLAELSFMGKEQFMTLPFVLFILSEGRLSARVKKTFPYFVILILHFFLRIAVLGGMGGYTHLTYNLFALVKTALESPLRESKLLFGTPWALVIVAAPALFSPYYMIRTVLLWILSLLIAFLVMGHAPALGEEYRYWFMATVLFSFFMGYNATRISNKRTQIVFVIVLVAMYSYTAFARGGELKAFFRKEATFARQIANVITDKRYDNSLFVYSATGGLSLRNYHILLRRAFSKVEGITSFFGTFYPSEIVASYPQLLNDFSAVYAVADTGIDRVPVTSAETSQPFSSGLIQEKPSMRFERDETDGILLWHCSRTWPIVYFVISREGNGYQVINEIMPYSDRIDLRAYMGNIKRLHLAIGTLEYHKRKWIIDNKELTYGYNLIVASCSDLHGQFTFLSDPLVIHRR